MKQVDEGVKARMWQGVNGPILHGIRVVLESRRPNAKKIDMITEITSAAFSGGVDLGYDMGAKVFGNE